MLTAVRKTKTTGRGLQERGQRAGWIPPFSSVGCAFMGQADPVLGLTLCNLFGKFRKFRLLFS